MISWLVPHAPFDTFHASRYEPGTAFGKLKFVPAPVIDPAYPDGLERIVHDPVPVVIAATSSGTLYVDALPIQ